MTKEHPLSWDTFAWHWLVFNCQHIEIRGHLPNRDRGQANRKMSIHYLAWGDSLQAVNARSTSISTHVLHTVRFRRNGRRKTRSNARALICFQYQIVSADLQWWRLNLPIIFCICSAFSTIDTTLTQKWHPQEKFLQQSTGFSSWNCWTVVSMPRCHAKLWVWKITNF